MRGSVSRNQCAVLNTKVPSIGIHPIHGEFWDAKRDIADADDDT